MLELRLAQAIMASAGFLLAVLWFDLMFDVQALAHRRSPEVPEAVLASTSAHYHRVTTTATPMGRLVALVMGVLLVALVAQAASREVAGWVSAVSLSAGVLAIGLAAGRVFGRARRLGARADQPAVQSALARSILRDHLICLVSMAVLLGVQIGGA
jgi:hypothetical protein